MAHKQPFPITKPKGGDKIRLRFYNRSTGLYDYEEVTVLAVVRTSNPEHGPRGMRRFRIQRANGVVQHVSADLLERNRVA